MNPQLVGKLPTASGLADDDSWLNYGGDKLWPAPQGWDNDEQWPGPPDAVLDGQPYTCELLTNSSDEAALRLTSAADLRSGIQFSRVIRVARDTTRVGFKATMKNIDTRPRRWGIWAHTQLDATRPDGVSRNEQMRAWCPLNPHSHFPRGFQVIFGELDNPSFQPDADRGLLQVQYRYQVGKIGLDSAAGWVATVDGAAGAAFVQRFVFEPQAEYPDGSSVEFWHNGVGTIHAYGKDMAMEDNPAKNPYVFESEVLSPYAQLEPGQSYTWCYDWYATSIGGDFPVLDCTPAGVVAEPLTATLDSGRMTLGGRFGVFHVGDVRAQFRDDKDRCLATVVVSPRVSPLQAVVLDTKLEAPPGATSVRLVLIDKHGASVGELAGCRVRTNDAPSQ